MFTRSRRISAGAMKTLRSSVRASVGFFSSALNNQWSEESCFHTSSCMYSHSGQGTK